MFKFPDSFRSFTSLCLVATALTTGAATAADPNPAVAPWLGKEITITSSSLSDHVPAGAKLTLVYDAEDDVVRVCTRSIPTKRAVWRMDFAVPCLVALNVVPGERYCSADDVNTGDAEILATCHRLRSHDVALHPAATKGAVELHDVIVFLLQPVPGQGHSIAILLDSPSRVTHAGHIIGDSP
jgi:hypothetical protein